MAEQARLSDIIKRLGEALPGKPPTDEIEKSVRAVAQSVFSKLDVVTREEFDAQAEVLRRTREKVQALEDQLEQLQASLEELDQ